jgi:hypothetical protein
VSCDRHFSRFGGVFELAMTATLSDQNLPILLHQSNHFAYLHQRGTSLDLTLSNSR